jgi:hypothetical protein
MKNVSDKFVEEIETHFLCLITFTIPRDHNQSLVKALIGDISLDVSLSCH